MKIYLDDIRDPPDNTWMLFRKAKELMLFIEKYKGEIETLSLDHDLGEGKLTGYGVLKWIEKKVFLEGYTPPKEILVHSDNPAGRKNMEAAIKSIYKTSPEI